MRGDLEPRDLPGLASGEPGGRLLEALPRVGQGGADRR